MKNYKYFIITIDTEADNQWDNDHDYATKNAVFLPRFQELAERYEYKPVWLTTYEMAKDKFFVKYFKEKQDKDLCEIGMHLHAWNNPPFYKLDNVLKERPYLIEYPIDIMDKKINQLDNLLIETFKQKPVSHRAGRWATNDDYFNLLDKYGYQLDCSVTPHINWEKHKGQTGICGSNYEYSEEKSFTIHNKLIEVPVTIRKLHFYNLANVKNIKSFIKELLKFIHGRIQWLRPDKSFDVYGIKKLIDYCSKKNEYLMFMIHSSELMPDGSPNFKNDKDIEKLYNNIELIFDYAKKKGYKGITLRNFRKEITNEKNNIQK